MLDRTQGYTQRLNSFFIYMYRRVAIHLLVPNLRSHVRVPSLFQHFRPSDVLNKILIEVEGDYHFQTWVANF